VVVAITCFLPQRHNACAKASAKAEGAYYFLSITASQFLNAYLCFLLWFKTFSVIDPMCLCGLAFTPDPYMSFYALYGLMFWELVLCAFYAVIVNFSHPFRLPLYSVVNFHSSIPKIFAITSLFFSWITLRRRLNFGVSSPLSTPQLALISW
jgi:hypothetical protein